MRKIIVILLCLSLVLTGCNRGKDKDEKENNNITGSVEERDYTEESDREKDSPSIGTKLLTLSKEWSLIQSLELTQKDYEVPSYDAKVPAYTIKKDLSNIENINQFSGFTKEEINMLATNGFVVVPSLDTRTYFTYEENEYKGIPNFITSDSVLHLYHQFYNKSLMSMEGEYLYDDLALITEQMLDKSILLLEELKEKDLIALQERNVIYFMVARMLFIQSTDLTVAADQKLIDIAKQEYELCKASEGYKLSPLIDKDLDYSQFKVRGHYTRSEELGKFFTTMMWFGTVPYALEDEEGNMIKEGILQSLLLTYTTFSQSEKENDVKLWSDIYQPTSMYVGSSDDITIFDMNSLRLSVFGNVDDPSIFNDDTYIDKLRKAVEELPNPQISADFMSVSTPTGKQFRFMGQRYILDSEILQKLIDSMKRPIPSSLDVMGVLGSSTAKDLLFNVYKPQDNWTEYTKRFEKLENKVKAYDVDYWKNNLYTGWLWSIQEVLTEYDINSGMPFFMTTKAWRYKTLNTALGSYTELKHDTVLYGKQAAAEMGGPEEFAEQHYVEPNINLYYKLLYLTDFTLSILEEKGMINEAMSLGAKELKDLLQLLIDCSVKELNNEALSEDEKKQLLWCGGKMERIMNQFILGLTGDVSNVDITDMLVTDISSALGSYLSLGTGYFDHIYVVVPVEGKLYLTRGSVYSSYEFVSGTRLTDEEWWALQGITINSSEYADFPEIGEKSDELPEQPAWVYNFKSRGGNIEITPLEVDWYSLRE